jgi:ribonuclease R
MAAPSKCSSSHAWRRNIVDYIADHPARPLKPRALANALNVPDAHYPEFRQLIRELIDEGILALGPGRAVVLPAQTGLLVGTFRRDARGHARLQRPGQPDLLVRRGFTQGALHGDVVAARLLSRRGHQGIRTVEITRIITPAEIRWTGVLERRGNRWFVQPHGRTPAPLVRIDDPTAKAARPGDMVVVEPLQRLADSPEVSGVIVERLGDPTRTETKLRAVIRRHGIPLEFPPDVRLAAQEAAATFDPAALRGRTDLRDLLTVTIDPPDARDFDDAISLQARPGGLVELGVHIADVAHFVPLDSPLDREARRRGNSVYLPGFVVPMLPETLSNGVCSLQPDQPRLAQSVFVTYDQAAKVRETRFARSVIQSRCRLTYEQASTVLAGHDSDLPTEVVDILRSAADMAERIRGSRMREGILVLTLPEVQIELDDDGNVVGASPADTSFSHTIIEMFMVEANEAVSRLLRQNGIPHLRRIHPPPDSTQATPLRQLAATLGLKLPAQFDRPALQRLLSAVHGRPEEPAVNLLLLQSLSQACYSPSHEEHFALASKDYCHFTSPIRRYPDLVNHRLLAAQLTRSQSRRAGRRRKAEDSEPDMADLASHSSSTERRAIQAEREAKALLLIELMKDKVGEELDGVVIGVTSFGLFVQVQPYLAEGLIHVSDFGSHDWSYDRQSASWTARRSGRVVSMGQPLRVRVAAVDERRSEMALVPAGKALLGVQRSAASSRTPRKKKSQNVGRNVATSGKMREQKSDKRGRSVANSRRMRK